MRATVSLDDPQPCRSLRLSFILDAVVSVTLTARILQKQRDRLLFLFGVQGAVVPAIFGSPFHSEWQYIVEIATKSVVINMMTIVVTYSDSDESPILRRCQRTNNFISKSAYLVWASSPVAPHISQTWSRRTGQIRRPSLGFLREWLL